MTRAFFVVFQILVLLSSAQVLASNSVELKLSAIKDVYQLKACSKPDKGSLFALGEFLFESKLMAGDSDIACRDCHLNEKGLGDGLPIAIGVGGEGHSEYRLKNGTGALVQRNAMPLFNRTHSGYTTLFWDGKIDKSNGVIFSPFGEYLDKGFKSQLAVAAILPLTERDEFLGQLALYSANDLQSAVGNKLYQKRFEALSAALRSRLRESPEFITLLEEANLTADSINLALIGNSIGDFIDFEFSCADSPWERYLAGEDSALSERQKEGAILFFGKARCASCHAPPLFTDFQFHGIGVPQGEFGPNPRVRDIGRANVTNKREDLYLFKTPPLVRVSETAPYGHNGVFSSVKDIVLHHVNPVQFFADNRDALQGNNRFRLAKFIDSRSEQLKFIEIDSDEELDAIVEFLNAL